METEEKKDKCENPIHPLDHEQEANILEVKSPLFPNNAPEICFCDEKEEKVDLKEEKREKQVLIDQPTFIFYFLFLLSPQMFFSNQTCTVNRDSRVRHRPRSNSL